MLEMSRTRGLGIILVGFAFLVAVGASAAPSNVAAWRRDGTFSQELGGAVGTAGDFNCDGNADLYIGAPNASRDPNGVPTIDGVGWVGVWFGSTTLPPQPSDAPDWFVIGTGTSNSNSANIGWHVAAGDVNGDGCDDLLIGEDRNQTESIPSSIRAYFGSAGVPDTTADWRRTFSSATDGSFGRQARTAIAVGDVGGDGIADIVVGLPFATRGQVGEGIVVVWFGGADLAAVPNGPADPVWFAESNQSSAKLGWSVSASGSINGDGFADIVAGAPDWDKTDVSPTQVDNGRAMAWAGHPLLQLEPTGTPANAIWTLNRINDGVAAPHYGTSVAIAGDLDGDGIADIVTGAPFYDDISHPGVAEGLTLVTFGGPAGPAVSVDLLFFGTLERGSYGQIVATAGDVNGDGFADFLVGEPRTTTGAPDDYTLHGRAHLFLGRKRASWNALPIQPTADVVYAEVGLPTTPLEQKFGSALGTAGDWNNDGFSDVIVGALGIDVDGINPGQREGVAFVYTGRSETIASAPTDTLRGVQAGDLFGLGVAFAGDINHDGFTDIVSGAPLYESDAGQTDEGRIFVHYGAECGASCGISQPNLPGEREGNQPGANLGWSVSGAGDINGDGFADVIAGAPLNDGSEFICGVRPLTFCPRPDAGLAQIFLGGPSGLGTTPSGSFAGDNQPNAKFGYSVSGAGDVNGDGYGDVIVGAPFGSTGLANEGRVFLYLGGPGGLSLTWSKSGGQANARFGIDVAGAGDVNGDGFGDVIIGADGYGPTGAAFIYLGRPTTPLFPQGLWNTPIRTLTGLQADSSFGATVASAGDVNRDGLADVVVGAPDFDDDPEFGPQIGMASVYHGGSPMPSGSPATNLFGTANISARFGSAVAGAGDVDGDGFGDLVVGDQWNSGTEGFAQGEAYIFHGSASGIQLVSARTLRDCPHGFCDYGQNVAGGGDVNGDGYSDVLIGAYRLSDLATDAGGVFVHLGNNGLGRARTPLQALASGGAPRALLGATASGFESSLALLTPAGRSAGELEIEVKSIGQDFDGASTQKLTILDNVSTPRAAIDFVGAEGTPYHWRARLKSQSPFFGRSRWISMPGNGVREIDVRVLPEPGVGVALAVAITSLAVLGQSRRRREREADLEQGST